MQQQQAADDILYGVVAIAGFFGLSRGTAQRQIERGEIPHFRLGGIVCARRSTLLTWIEEQERNSRTQRNERPAATSAG